MNWDIRSTKPGSKGRSGIHPGKGMMFLILMTPSHGWL